MGLTPVFNPDTGASGGPSPATPAAPADGSPKLVINTNMQASPTVDMSSVGTYTVDGIQWTTTAAVADTCEADSTGWVVDTDDATQTGIVTQIPNVAQGDFICIAVVFDSITAFTANNSTVFFKLGSAAGTTDSEYDLFMTLRKTSGTNYRVRNAYRGSSSWTTAYIGDNPWHGGSVPSRVVLSMWGSGYSWTTAVTSAAGVPDFRAVTASNNAGGSLRSRGGGQTQADTDPPNLQYLKIFFNSQGGRMTGKVIAVRVWVGARVVS
jgi:hypothetical protein